MRFGLSCLAFLVTAPAVTSPTVAPAAPVLERVIMVSRHGVRAPIKSVDVLDALTKRGWPAWPVGPGEMTEHGAKDLALMSDFLRATYASEGILPAKGCPAAGAVEVWSDGKDHRTVQSGQIFADRIAPGCGLHAGSVPAGRLDPVFDSSKSGSCAIGLIDRAKAFLGAARDNAGRLLTPQDRHALETLQGILAPDACKTVSLGICLVPGTDASSATTAADIALGATIAEGLYLEYEQGLPAADIGWGKAGDPETIAAIMPVHEHGIEILRRTPVLAARHGAVMARTILAFLQRRPLPAEAPRSSPDARLVMLAGHDSNLLYLAGIMGLDWRLPNQPSITAPDTTLAFELWHDPATDKRTVKVVVYAQTLAQLREGTVLDDAHRPDVVPVVPEGCATAGAGGCEVATFAGDVERRLASLCGG